MKLLEILRLVWLNIVQNRTKMLLSSLGVMAGAVTIVLVIAIGDGGEAQAMEAFGDLRPETLNISLDYMYMTDTNTQDAEPLTLDAMNLIIEENPYIKTMAMNYSNYNRVQAGGKEDFIPVSGVTDGLFGIMNADVAYGYEMTEPEIENAEPVAVLGGNLADKLFGSGMEAVGQTILIGNMRYLVAGVLENGIEGLQGINPNETAFVPYSTLQENPESPAFPQIVGLANDLGSVEPAKKRIESTLAYTLDTPEAYKVDDAGSRMEVASEVERTIKTVLVSVAAIVFVVGGIGIMNVLFVSVKERTKEIGILKAMGAKRADILRLFLLESVVISIFGGVIGVFLSIALSPLMSQTGIPTLYSWNGIVAALAFSILTGSAFGFYPAYQASRLAPIDALSYE